MKRTIITLATIALLTSCGTKEVVEEYTPEQLEIIKQIEFYQEEGRKIDQQLEDHRRKVDNTIKEIDREIKLSNAKNGY